MSSVSLIYNQLGGTDTGGGGSGYQEEFPGAQDKEFVDGEVGTGVHCCI